MTEASQDAPPPTEAPRHVVVTVHGIRTFGQWQERLRTLIHAQSPDTVVETFGYGYFSVIAFVLPVFRWLAVLFFRQRLRALLKEYPGAKFTFVSHSFGTHLTIYGLKGLRPHEAPRIHRIILAGSVLRPNFNWPHFLEKIPAGGVINDCGINDSVLIMSQFVVLLTGMAGRVGFYGFTGEKVINRYFVGGHSHYFEPTHLNQDYFMEKRWLPLLLDPGQLERIDQRPEIRSLDGVTQAVTRFADPIKIVCYGLIIWLAVDSFYLAPRRDLLAEQAAREVTVAGAALDLEGRAPNAYEVALRVLKSTGPVKDRDRIIATNIARYAAQKLKSFDEVYKATDPVTVVRWSDAAYATTSPPLRLQGLPVWYVPVDQGKKLLTLDADSTVTLIDLPSRKIMMRQHIDNDKDAAIGDNMDVLTLKDEPDRVLLKFSSRATNDEDSHFHAVVVKMAGGDAEDLAGSDSPVDLTATADCKSFDVATEIDDDDDDERSKEALEKLNQKISAEKLVAARCIGKLMAQKPRFLSFPDVGEEVRNWTAAAIPLPVLKEDDTWNEPCHFDSESVRFPHTVRQDPQVLDFSKMSADGGDIDSDTAKGFFINADNGEGCFIEFKGAEGRGFTITHGLPANWYGSHFICELFDGKTLGRCVTVRYSAEGTGDIYLSPDRNFLGVAGFGEQNGGAWDLIDLRTMTTSSPEDGVRGGISSITFDYTSRTLFAVGAVDGQVGTMRLDVYDISGKITPLASRIIASSRQAKDVSSSDANPMVNVSIFSTGSNYIVASPYGDVLAFSARAPDLLSDWVDRVRVALGGASTRPAGISVDWLANPLGFSAEGEIRYDFRPGTNQLLAYDQKRVRVMDVMAGYMLTAIAAPVTQLGCGEKIQSAALGPEGGVSVRSDTCQIERKAPPDAKALASQDNSLSPLVPSETDGQQRLPGEELVQCSTSVCKAEIDEDLDQQN